jgi:hypothetical protein
VNAHNPRDLRAPSAGPGASQAGARDGLSVDFYTQCRTVLIDADDMSVPRFDI